MGQSISYTRKFLHTTVQPEKNHKKRTYPKESVNFSEEDMDDILNPHEDLLVIQIDIGKDLSLAKVMVNNECLVDILYLVAFEKMDFKKEQLTPTKEAIYSFTNTEASVVGTIDLEVFLGKRKGKVSRTAHFIVINISSPFNVILGRPSINASGI